jgi:hypothetical protein
MQIASWSNIGLTKGQLRLCVLPRPLPINRALDVARWPLNRAVGSRIIKYRGSRSPENLTLRSIGKPRLSESRKGRQVQSWHFDQRLGQKVKSRRRRFRHRMNFRAFLRPLRRSVGLAEVPKRSWRRERNPAPTFSREMAKIQPSSRQGTDRVEGLFKMVHPTTHAGPVHHHPISLRPFYRREKLDRCSRSGFGRRGGADVGSQPGDGVIPRPTAVVNWGATILCRSGGPRP